MKSFLLLTLLFVPIEILGKFTPFFEQDLRNDLTAEEKYQLKQDSTLTKSFLLDYIKGTAMITLNRNSEINFKYLGDWFINCDSSTTDKANCLELSFDSNGFLVKEVHYSKEGILSSEAFLNNNSEGKFKYTFIAKRYDKKGNLIKIENKASEKPPLMGNFNWKDYKYHGMVKKYNRKGKLISSYEFDYGEKVR